MFMKLLHLELQIYIVARNLCNDIVAGGENLPATFLVSPAQNNPKSSHSNQKWCW